MAALTLIGALVMIFFVLFGLWAFGEYLAKKSEK